jgi:hypothetical protein
MAIIDLKINLPERQNEFFNSMAGLLPKQIFNVDPEFMIPRIEPVSINGTVVPLATVKVFINGLDQSPVPDIVADSLGAWSASVLLTPGQNTIQVQFFPPEIQQQIDDAFAPGFTEQNVLTHPTLFSAYALGAPVADLVLDGTDLFIGGTAGMGTNLLVKYDITTGIGVFRAYGTASPASGQARFMAVDSNWLYISQTMSDASIKLSRYDKALSARTDLAYGTVPNALHADGTFLWVVRDTGSDSKLSKVDPATMTISGSEISIKNGALSELFIKHNAMADDGTYLYIPTSRLLAGDSPGNSITAGSPDLGANLIFWWLLFHRKIRKSDMADMGNLTTYSTQNFSDDADMIAKNSLIKTGGYFYSLALCNPGKVIKLQEGVVDGLPALAPIDVIPLPFDTTASMDALVPKMELGPDSRLYVVGNGAMARFTPGSASIEWLPRGAIRIDATLNDVAVVDDMITTRAVAAPIAIFADRADTFTIVTPASAPSNVRCHFNNTHTGMGIGWDPMAEATGFIVEQAVNLGAFSEVKREYFGNGCFVQSSLLPTFHSGDDLRYRVKAFNQVGTSVASAEAVFSVPYLTPPLGDCTNLLLTSVVGSNVTVHFDDGEITLGGPINSTTNRPHVLFLYRSPDGLTNWTQVAARSMIPDNVQPDGTPVGGAFTYNPSTRADQQVTMVDTTATVYPYFYRVRAEQRDGPSLSFPSFVYGPGAYSNVIQVDAPPATPTGVFWEAGWEGAFIGWTPGVGGGIVTGYTVKRSTDNSVSYPVSFPLGNVTSYHDTTAFGNAQVRYDKIFASGPGGNSADSPIQGGAFSLAPVYHEIKVTNIGSSGGPLLLDGSFAYYVSGDASSVNVVITKIDLSDSSIRTQNLSVYIPVGTFTTVGAAIMIGGYIHILIKDQGEANSRIIKIDPSNLTQVATLALTSGNGNHNLITDGTNCWATNGPNGSVKITQFDPSTMSNVLTGASLGAGLNVGGGTAFGAGLFITTHNFNTATDQVHRINQATLAIDQSAATSAVTFPDYMVNDGSNVYFHGTNGAQGRIEKFSTGPLTFVASTADLGSNGVTSLVYDSGSSAIYLAHRQTALVGGTFNSIMKVSNAPAFVSAISQSHFNQGQKDGAKTDGTYVYLSNNGGYVARELISAF